MELTMRAIFTIPSRLRLLLIVQAAGIALFARQAGAWSDMAVRGDFNSWGV
ncbi:MAG: hypothetical protein U1F77_19305 [Kiritimatiellia bacterium]